MSITNTSTEIILFVTVSSLCLKIVTSKIPNVGISPMNKSKCIQSSPSLSCEPPEYSFIEISLSATNKYVRALKKINLILFVLRQTIEVVIIKTIGVNKIPFGAKKCPISPFKITVKVASPMAVLFFFIASKSVRSLRFNCLK